MQDALPEEQPEPKRPTFLRAVPKKENLLEGQRGQPVHKIVTNALKKAATQHPDPSKKKPRK